MIGFLENEPEKLKKTKNIKSCQCKTNPRTNPGIGV
jgi:hypothetical protein